MEMDEKLGARVHLAANVSILFHGKKTSYDVINATTDMHLTVSLFNYFVDFRVIEHLHLQHRKDFTGKRKHFVFQMKPTIRSSRLYGDVALTSVDFDIKHVIEKLY